MTKERGAEIAMVVGLAVLALTFIYLKGYGMPTIPVSLISVLSATGAGWIVRDHLKI